VIELDEFIPAMLSIMAKNEDGTLEDDKPVPAFPPSLLPHLDIRKTPPKPNFTNIIVSG